MSNKILIVDDTLNWLLFHKETIEELYPDIFEITLAHSAFEALDIIRHNINNPFDVVFTDLQMESDFEPKLAGEWLVEQIQLLPSYKSKKIVIISAMYNIEHIAQNLNVECISKTILLRNKLLMKFMLEKAMPFLTKME